MHPFPLAMAVARTSNGSDFAAMMGVLLLVLMLELVVFLVFYAAYGIAWLGVFRKAGYPGWAGFVPFYNTWVLAKIGGRRESDFWLTLIPYAGIYWQVLILNNVSKSFGKDSAFTVGLVFLPWVFAGILSFGDARYLGPSYRDPQMLAYGGYPQPYGQNPPPP
ncbi:DUF5684 domain-containing protein [Paenarthrobacter sp. PH39-S1]|uniref:DUF5684 domain-containing protein n=1 Tax=Paenarthrobacter sp. PH39-S1 TaxID=3046204 RepID=UPI0024BAFEDE|nr:DUF5684 domain-containing protein [Paenarthrobacter sp. PH39-S1]MDJ0354938.1 DUF5684 domain-containing protein [Paenarthrobacter sp. PH39-S1]